MSEPTVLTARAPVRPSYRTMVKTYYYLTKPGIIYSNVMTAAAGYLFATRWHGSMVTLLTLLVGNGLIIGSACVLNNYIDRGIDKKMNRTKTRGLVTGAISGRNALVYGSCLGALGFALLIRTNTVTVLVAVVALFTYVVLYAIAKRRSPHGTLVGTLPGAASLVAGYSAAAGSVDTTAALLFLIMVAWQMAHFYAIAIYRLDDYKAAGLPVWPARHGVTSAKRFILGYIAAFVACNATLVLTGHAGRTFLAVMLLVSGYWLWAGLRTFARHDASVWARGMFGRSLVALLVFALILPLQFVMPG